MAVEKDYADEWDELNAAKGATGAVDDADNVTVAADAALAGDDEPAAPAAPVVAAAAPPVDDPWAGISDAQREAIERIEADRKEIQRRAGADAGRVAALQRQLDQMQQRLASVPQVVQAAPAVDPETQKFMEEYPDIAGPVTKLLSRERENLTKEFQGRLQPIAQRQAQVDTDNVAAFIAGEMDAVEEAHAGWRQTVASPDFGQWVQTQPPGIQALGGSSVAADAIAMLDLFTSATSSVVEITKRRQNRLAQAVSVQGNRAASPPGRAAIPEDFDAAWDALAAQKQASAQR